MCQDAHDLSVCVSGPLQSDGLPVSSASMVILARPNKHPAVLECKSPLQLGRDAQVWYHGAQTSWAGATPPQKHSSLLGTGACQRQPWWQYLRSPVSLPRLD